MTTRTTHEDRDTKRGLLTFGEVCDRLGISRNTGYLLIKRGEFPLEVLKIGTRLYCCKTDVDRYLHAA